MRARGAHRKEEPFMKKRIVSLLLCLVMALSVILTGCSGGNQTGDTDEVTDKASSSTITLKMYVVCEKPVSEETAKTINAAFNKITKSSFKTQVNLSFCTYDTYYDTIENVFGENQKLAALKEEARKHLKEAKKAAKAQGIDANTVEWLDAYYAENPQYAQFRGEDEVSEEETSVTAEETVMEEIEGADGAAISVLKYPDEKANQIDIFWFDGYDRYIEYIENEWVAAVDDNVGAKLKEYLNPDLLAWIKQFGQGMTYAIPNNNPIGEYTYLLLNKELIDHYSYDPATMDSLADCENFLKDVATYSTDYLPVVGELPVVNAHYWSYDMSTNRINPNKFSVIASSTFNNLIGGHMDLDVTKTNNPVMSISNIFRNPDYVSQLRTIQKYKDLGYVSAAAGADQKFAVSVVKGGAELAKIYGDDYYMNVLEYPRISENDVCGSMFGVSSYSVNVARAMEIITAINTNSALRNILQYGVEEVHYQLDEDGNLTRLNNDYMMDVAKTGNMFIAHPEEGVDADVWSFAKTQNYSALPTLTLGFGIFDPANINNEGPSTNSTTTPPTTDENGEPVEEEDRRLAAYLIPQVEKISAEVEAALKAVKNSEELEALITKYTVDCQKNEGVTTHASASTPSSVYYYYLTWMLESGFNSELVLE